MTTTPAPSPSGAETTAARAQAAAGAPSGATAGTLTLLSDLIAQLQTGSVETRAQAAARLQTLTEEHPNNGPVRMGVGIAFALQGHLIDAGKHFEKAVLLDPKLAPAWSNLGNIHKLRGQLKEASKAYRKAIDLQPDLADAHYNLALVLEAEGKDTEAVASLHRALLFRPSYPEVHNNLGHMMLKSGKVEQAISHFRQALVFNPLMRQAQDNLIMGLYRLGRTAEASAEVVKLLTQHPDDPRVLRVQAAGLAQMGNLGEAEAINRKLMALEPDAVDLQLNMGQVLMQKQDYAGAMACYQALLDKGNAPPAVTIGAMGSVMLAQGNPTEARALFQQALMLEPKATSLLANMARALMAAGDIRLGVETLKRAVALQPSSAELHAQLCLALRADTSVNEADGEQEWKRWRKAHAQVQHHIPFANPEHHPSLRVGLLVGDLEHRIHALALEVLLEKTDPLQVDLHVYHCHPAGPEAARLQKLAPHWKSLTSLGHADCTELIRMDGIQVLVDTMGHGPGGKQVSLSARAAPAQVVWTCHADIQATWMDAYMGVPMALNTLVSEAEGTTDAHQPKPLLLPVAAPWTPETHALSSVSTDTNEEQNGKAPQALTFGVLAQPGYLHAEALDSLAAILTACPEARLMVQTQIAASDTDSLNRIPRLLTLRDVEPIRVDVLPASEPGMPSKLLTCADLMLDTTPHPMGLDALDFLWQGIPVLSVAGKHHWQTGTSGVLKALECSDWIASDTSTWVDMAVATALAPIDHGAIQEDMRRRIQASAFMDRDAFAQAWTQAVRSATP